MSNVVNLIQVFREDISVEDYCVALEILKEYAVFFTLVRNEETDLRIQLLKENNRKIFNGLFRFLNDKMDQASIELEDYRVTSQVVWCDALVLNLYHFNEQTVNILKKVAKGFFSPFLYGLTFLDGNTNQVLVSLSLEDCGYVINNAVAREFIDRLESFTCENRVLDGTEKFMQLPEFDRKSIGDFACNLNCVLGLKDR